MADTFSPSFNPSTQPTLCKLARNLNVVREAKAKQVEQQRGLNKQLTALAQKIGGAVKDKTLAAQIERATLRATEAAFEHIVPTTVQYALANAPAQQLASALQVLLLRKEEHVQQYIPAPLGENGWMSCKVPVGADFDSALLLGAAFAWCQIGDVYHLMDESDTEARVNYLRPGKMMVLDGLTAQGENIYTLSEAALIYFPANLHHGTAASAVVQFRPLILRKPLTLQIA